MDEISILYDNFRRLSSQFLEKGCAINGTPLSLEEIQNMSWQNFANEVQKCMPQKLYKYFPNKTDEKSKTNYSIQALKNNTVFLQSPDEFDDIYDSEFSISFEEYERFRLIDCCARCGIEIDKQRTTYEIGTALCAAIKESYDTHGDFKHIFKNHSCENEQLANIIFCNEISTAMKKYDDIGLAIKNLLSNEYTDYLSKLKNTFRVSCFTTTPYSQLMWGGAYADFHRGFCIEYTVLHDDAYNKILYSLFPLIYSKKRTNIAEKLVSNKDKTFTKEYLQNIYFNGVLRKSLDWAFQNEWRLLLPSQINMKTDDYNIKFFPITKVFLGNRMLPEEKKKIIDICHEKNIPYVGVTKASDKFEMQDCKILCEHCPQFVGRNIP